MVSIEKSDHNQTQIYRVVIVGVGPKGLYALERLLAQIKYKSIRSSVEIHLFNSSENFGSGDIYAKDQPPYLIMNYASSNITAWTNELPPPVVEIPLKFTDWVLENELESTSGNSLNFAPRSLVGLYLNTIFKKLIQYSPKNVTYKLHQSVVSDISKEADQFRIFTKRHSESSVKKIDTVLLTTGHLGNGADFFPCDKDPAHVEFIYPTKDKLAAVGTGNIIIRGFGLTCIDAILELTEGREGKFKEQLNGLEYLCSGNEPNCMYIVSRSGLPMFPRISDDEEIETLYYFTEKNIEKISNLSFTKHLLPLIKREFFFQYYKSLFRLNNCELLFDKNFAVVEKQVSDFHLKFPDLAHYCWEQFVDPFVGQKTISHQQMLTYLTFLNAEAEKGLRFSPIMSAAGTWRKISPVFNNYYSFGKLDADSHRLFDSYYFGLFNRLAYGPPVQNSKKMVALAEEGILNFSAVRNSDLVKSKNFRDYELRILQKNTPAKESVPGNYEVYKLKIDALINARIPKGIDSRPNLLFYNLIQRGLLRNFTNRNAGIYKSQGIDINASGNAINAKGVEEVNFSLYGTPTEGVTHDNDTLSRTRNNMASKWARKVVQDLENNKE